MSKSEEKALEKEQGEPRPDPVYDFLYQDKKRVGSFLAQFDDFGHLQQITHGENVSEQRQIVYKTAASGGGNILVASGKADIGVDQNVGEQGSESTQRIYDPYWTNARTFLDFLAEKGMINNDIKLARFGQIVMVSGELSIINSMLVRRMFELPAIKSYYGKIVDKSINKNKAAGRPSMNGTMIMEYYTLFPNAINATIDGDSFSVWCTLPEDGLVVTFADVALKHGYMIPGKWHMVGILDAMPGDLMIEATPEPSEVLAKQAAEESPTKNHNMDGLAKSFSLRGRQHFGRPETAYGMTPLLIYREVF
jgi:hypothetical protein